MKLGQAMYEAAQGADDGEADAAAASRARQQAAKDDDVVDADFEEVDEDQNRKKSA